jgi:hypothetical protein
MYVYISQTCQQQAKLYQIEQKVEELASWIKDGSRQDFVKLFEIFQHPYYVRKGICYRYRLLAKMIEVSFGKQSYQIVVFFRLFLRGDDEYKMLFHQADEHGDFFYNQQHLDTEIANNIERIITLAKPSHPSASAASARINQSDSLLYFIQAKTNLLQLSPRAAHGDYYQEDLSWHHGLRPFLTAQQLQTTYCHIQHALDSSNSPCFEIAGAPLQFQLAPLRLSQTPDKRADAFTRYLPPDTVFDQDSWLVQQNNTLPLCLNDFQQTVGHQIFEHNASFPLLVNAPALHGKTSILAILTAHYLLQLPDTHQGVLPVLFVCEPHEKLALRTAIANYLLYQFNHNHTLQLDITALIKKIDACCMDLSELAYKLAASETCCLDKDLFIDRHKFGKLWEKAPFIKNHKLAHIPVDLAWWILQHLIKGEQGILGEGKAFAAGLTSYSRLTPEQYQQVYEEVWLNWYQPLQEDGYWDLHDLLSNVNCQADFPQRYACVLVDNAEQYSKLAIQVMLRCSEWWERPNLFVQAPLVLMGNGTANLSQSLYHWHNELNSLLYRLYRSQSEDEQLQTQHIDYHLADFVTTTNYALQSQRSKTNLISFDNTITKTTVLIENQLLFVDITDTALTQALLLNHKIALVVNSDSRDSKKALKNPKMLGQWFQYADVSQIERACYSLTQLPTKHYRVALVGFTHPDFAYFHQDSKDFAFLGVEKRYQLNNLLNAVNVAANQGLKQIFILARPEELPLWQTLFCPVLGVNAIQTATLDDINPHYQEQTAQFIEQRQQALESGDHEKLLDIAIQHYQRFEYPQYFALLLKSCQLTQDYQDYFDNLITDPQKQLTFDYLWQQHNAQVILQYQDYFTKAVQYNIMGIQLIHELPLALPFDNAFIQITNHYVKQYQQPPYAAYWQIIFDKILQKLLETPPTTHWDTITRQLMHLEKSGIAIPQTVLAMSHYRQGDTQRAFALWQQLDTHDYTLSLPNIYYEHCLKHSSDWQMQLLILIKLRKLGELMNMLTNHELNDLQASYWDKILPYLEEEAVLETALLALLPQIHDQSILEKIYQYCQFDTSENFVVRLQRLTTLQACLQGDWDKVIERLEHYVPVQDAEDMMSKLSQVFTTKKVMRGPNHVQKTVLRDKLPKPSDEIIDILYALNLNPAFYIPVSVSDFEHYSKQPSLQKIFALIRQNLSLQTDDSFNDVLWTIDFPAVRSLAYLLEKSDRPKDALVFYANITSFNKDKKLMTFAIERLSFLIDRAKQLIADGLDTAYFTASDTCAPASDDLTALIHKFEKHYDKLLKKAEFDPHATNLPVLKTPEQLVKLILALTDKEHREIQRLEQEQRQALKEQEAEAKRIAQEEEQQAQQRARLEDAIRLKEIKEQQRLENERLTRECLENEQLAQAALTQQASHPQVADNAADEAADQPAQNPPPAVTTHPMAQSCHDDAHSADCQNRLDTPSTLETTIVSHNDSPQSIAQHSQPHALNNTDIKAASTILPDLTPCQTSFKSLITKATSELQFFHWRVFVNRMTQRVNIESVITGERCSITLANGILSSDWAHCDIENGFEFLQLPLVVMTHDHAISLYHTQEGTELSIKF